MSKASDVRSNGAVTGSSIEDEAILGGQTRRNPAPTIENHRVTVDEHTANPEIRCLIRQPKPAFDSMHCVQQPGIPKSTIHCALCCRDVSYIMTTKSKRSGMIS